MTKEVAVKTKKKTHYDEEQLQSEAKNEQEENVAKLTSKIYQVATMFAQRRNRIKEIQSELADLAKKVSTE